MPEGGGGGGGSVRSSHVMVRRVPGPWRREVQVLQVSGSSSHVKEID